MKNILTAVACILAFSRAVMGQCDDPYDGTLCVQKITAQQASQFSVTDNQVSPFWAQITGDRVDLVAPDNCATGNCGFTGTDDASTVILAAATTQGIYIYIAVQDNTWVDRSSPDACCDDSADLYLDEMDANSIATCTSCLIGLYSSSLTYTTNQLQVSMGASALPADFRFAYYDNNLWSWQTISLSWSNAVQLYGFAAEVVTIDATHKAQEWFFPWEKVGDGIAAGTNLNGKRLGFAGGYNDKDGDNVNADQLRWPEAGDPWDDYATGNYWGDLLLPSDMGVVEPMAVHQPSHSAVRDRLSTGMTRAERFSLTGQRVGHENTAHSGLYVERAVHGDRAVSAISCTMR